ncbi:hypothetical protein MFLO_15975 [Listeria floridensis FSL S10-1187]|uniref:Uncharacterized protein n=1 Tax=Listeria floridensis FSL S10-1187 TaxID=1265817 RepID=A0ABP3AW73_9LIST|nr:hypothetical protein [Listeria floridensis]EUJ23463.1 hypothetical protein MFLO_15975 [Listeria floridensis FSL S10-1187]
MKISYDSTELIAELKNDIKEFGRDIELWCFFKFVEKQKIYTNYDFIVDDEVKKEELGENGHLDRLPARKLLERLEEQDRIM